VQLSCVDGIWQLDPRSVARVALRLDSAVGPIRRPRDQINAETGSAFL
jgi:hypothetical protein